jgi:hypothetical protein
VDRAVKEVGGKRSQVKASFPLQNNFANQVENQNIFYLLGSISELVESGEGIKPWTLRLIKKKKKKAVIAL